MPHRNADSTPHQRLHPLMRSVRDMIDSTPALAIFKRTHAKGFMLFREGEGNDTISIILEGRVQLRKGHGEDEAVPVGTLGPGDFVGLLSFYGGGTTFVSVWTTSSVSLLRFPRADFDQLPVTFPALHALLHPLIIRSLADRYRKIVRLHLDVAVLSRDLEQERVRMQATLEELRNARTRLIHQEKMAILGQLIAGIAHEINNPAAALVRAADYLSEGLPRSLAEGHFTVDQAGALLQAGLRRQPLETAEQHRRMAALAQAHPGIPRQMVRLLAQMDRPTLTQIEDALRTADTTHDLAPLQRLAGFFEAGMFLHNVRVASEQINVVASGLKSYSREGSGEFASVDVREGIRDILLILGNRLKRTSIVLHLNPVPPIRCLPGEINQVWTNIILNACDAMGEQGNLVIGCLFDHHQQSVVVSFQDNGSGVTNEDLERIFEPNYTTKTGTGSFGLGLGLTISREIILKHGGTITLANRAEGGALITVTLPADLPAITAK
jgi:signal transduction histidine kinase